MDAESREGEFSLALEILRDDSGTFIGLREFPLPPRRTGAYEERRRRNQGSRLGLFHRAVPAVEKLEATHQPERKRVRRRSPRKHSDFEIREFPITLAESVETGKTAKEFVSGLLTGNNSRSSAESH